MATRSDIYSIMQPQNPVVGRVMAALFKVAWQILAEDPATENHANRLALAHQVINDPDPLRPRVWRLFLSNATVQGHFDDLDGGLTDNDIEYVVKTEQLNTLANLVAASEVT